MQQGRRSAVDLSAADRTIGRSAVALSILSLLPSVVPGAVSLMGWALSVLALLLAVFSAGAQAYYFIITLALGLFALLLVNDGLRIWQALPMPLTVKVTLYCAHAGAVGVCVLAVRYLRA